jgi:protocadherin alpha
MLHRHLPLQLLLLLVVGTFVSITFAEPQELMATRCLEQKTCGQCMAAGPPCGWCKQEKEEFENRERCDTIDNLLSAGCSSTFIENPPKKIIYDGNLPPRNSERGQEAVQLSPQNITIKLRPNSPVKFLVSFRQAENYPVDLYYVMDMSNSMEDDKARLAGLGDLLANKMKNITQNFRLGFGSFVDKKTMPYVSTVPDKLREPCTNCAAPYGFRNQLNLTEDTGRFKVEVMNTQISGNLDAPEGGFDAVMQAISCRNEIGWRGGSRKMLLFSTDAGFHYAGDGKLGGIVTPNDGQCHLDHHGLYTESLNQDYPSISQLAHKIAETKVNVIFAVTKDQIRVYQELSKLIEGSTVGELANDSSNIVELVKDNYDKISGSVELKAEGNEDIIVNFKARCIGQHSWKDTAKCDGVGIAQNVTYEVSVEVKSCPADRSQWKRTFQIYPVGLTEKLTINLELNCECDCERTMPKLTNNEKCKSFGTYECGACTCNDGYYGRHCECDGSTLSSNDQDAACRETNSSLPCGGRGQCVCGKCECSPVIVSGDPSKRYRGKFCQCNDYSCDHYEKMICGGPSRGRCDCGECICKEGYIGKACHCLISNDTCIGTNGQLCSGRGDCICGKCECTKDPSYKGPTCEDCPTCAGKCDQIKDCVLCVGFGTGPLKDDMETCRQKCNHTIVVDELDVGPEWKQCPVIRDDSDNCDVFYVYHYDPNVKTVEVQKTKRCTPPVNVLAIVLGVIGGIILIGLLLLLIWKLLVTIHDRREFARFEKERENARWDMGENPIYKQATSTYKNPTYAIKS